MQQAALASLREPHFETAPARWLCVRHPRNSLPDSPVGSKSTRRLQLHSVAEASNVDFSKWPTQSTKITRLRLDPENPRLATSVKRPTQQELIADLLEHEEVMDLVRDIARQGYFPNESLVAIRDGANTIVIEGNRRLAALKLLLNPELAPDAYQKRIRQHAERHQHAIQKVQVVLAPSRTAAVPLLIARHNGEPVKRWTTIMQARFLQSRIDHGLGIDEVAEETGLERAEIVRQLRDAKLYDVIRSLPLAPRPKKLLATHGNFPSPRCAVSLNTRPFRVCSACRPMSATVSSQRYRATAFSGFWRAS